MQNPTTLQQLQKLGIKTQKPSIQQAIHFMSQKYNLHPEFHIDKTSYPKYCFYIYKFSQPDTYQLIPNPNFSLYKTLQEAQLDCLIHLIEIEYSQNNKI